MAPVTAEYVPAKVSDEDYGHVDLNRVLARKTEGGGGGGGGHKGEGKEKEEGACENKNELPVTPK